MKFSISVPDELWQQVAVEGSGPSTIVQEGLRLLAERRAASRSLCPSAPGRLAASRELRAQFAVAAKRAAAELQLAEETGYRLGIELGAFMRIDDFDRLAADPSAFAEQVLESIRYRLNELLKREGDEAAWEKDWTMPDLLSEDLLDAIDDEDRAKSFLHLIGLSEDGTNFDSPHGVNHDPAGPRSEIDVRFSPHVRRGLENALLDIYAAATAIRRGEPLDDVEPEG